MGLLQMGINGLKKDVRAIDRDKNGKPDVIEKLDQFEAGMEKIEKYASRLQPAHVAALLRIANNGLHPTVFSDTEIVEFAEAICSVDDAAHFLKALAEDVEKQILN